MPEASQRPGRIRVAPRTDSLSAPRWHLPVLGATEDAREQRRASGDSSASAAAAERRACRALLDDCGGGALAESAPRVCAHLSVLLRPLRILAARLEDETLGGRADVRATSPTFELVAAVASLVRKGAEATHRRWPIGGGLAGGGRGGNRVGGGGRAGSGPGRCAGGGQRCRRRRSALRQRHWRDTECEKVVHAARLRGREALEQRRTGESLERRLALDLGRMFESTLLLTNLVNNLHK